MAVPPNKSVAIAPLSTAQFLSNNIILSLCTFIALMAACHRSPLTSSQAALADQCLVCCPAPTSHTLCCLQSIATISAGNDELIGSLIAEALDQVGADGVLSIEESRGLETTVDVQEGMEIDRGYISPQFITNNVSQHCGWLHAVTRCHMDDTSRPEWDARPRLKSTSWQAQVFACHQFGQCWQ